MKRVRTAIVAVAAILLAVLVAFTLPRPDDHAFKSSTDPNFEQHRLEYQLSLARSEQRVEPDFYVIVLDGRVYMRTDLGKQVITGYCRIRCGTIVNDGGSYRVSLPVGYAHGSNVVPDPVSWEPVKSLTYWNPLTRLVETIVETNGDGVVLPEVLKDNLTSADIHRGETLYTNADFIRRTSTGETRMMDNVLAYELLGREYGYALNTAVTRRILDGRLVVKMPANVVPIVDDTIDDTHFVPVTVVS